MIFCYYLHVIIRQWSIFQIYIKYAFATIVALQSLPTLMCNTEIYKPLKYRTIVVTGTEIMNDEADKNDWTMNIKRIYIISVLNNILF